MKPLSKLTQALRNGYGRAPARRRERAGAMTIETVEARLLLSAVVETNLPDYSPGDTALIRAYNDASEGTDFAAGELVTFQVTRTDGVTDYPNGNLPWYVRDGVDTDHYEDSDGDGSLDRLVLADTDAAAGQVGTSWYVEDQYASSTLRLTATGDLSGATATHDFTDAGQFSWSPTDGSQSVNVFTGSSATLANVVLTVPQNNGTQTPTIAFTGMPPGLTVGYTATADSDGGTIGTVTTTNGNNGSQTITYSFNISATGSVAPGTYTIRAQASPSSGTINSPNNQWDFDVVVQAPATASLSLGAQTGTATYGGATDNVTFAIDATRLTNGAFNGTYTVTGLPAGVTGTFLPTTFTATGNAALTDSTLTLAVGAGVDQGSYAFTVKLTNSNGGTEVTATGTLVVAARALNVQATVNDQVYDGDAIANNGAGTVTLSDNRESGDVLNISFTSATFADKNVGDEKVVTIGGISISGADAHNYVVNTSDTDNADITQRALTVSATGVNKVYDGTTSATVTLSDNRIGGDVFIDSYTSASFADKNVGIGKTVSVSGISIGGTDAGNYSFNTTASTTADITQRALTVSATGVNKVYDGTTSATVTLSDNRIGGDVFIDSYTSASFADKNVGIGKTVSVSGISIGGTDAGNYSFNTTASTTADITQRALTVSATGVNKVYDGTTSATVTLSDNRIGGDVFIDSYTSASFADKNVGIGKTVSVSGISIGGTDAGNYSFNTTASTTADITQRALTVSATGVNKVYDGTTSATVTLSDNRIGGDVFIDSYTSASFADKNVGIGKTVSVSGISIGGTDAGNYSFNTTASTTADITQRALTVSATGVNKVYDGTTSATVTLSDNRIGGDVFIDSYTSASFADKNVGIGKTVSVSGISIGGTDAGNYSFNTTASTTADISAKALTVSIVGTPTKTYDGNTNAALTSANFSISGLVSGENFTINQTSGTYNDEDVLDASTVSATLANGNFVAADDESISNYSYNSPATGAGKISAKAVTLYGTREYDGTDAAKYGILDVTNVVGTDDVDVVSGQGTLASMNVGTRAITSVGTLVLGGADAGNYTLTGASGNVLITLETGAVTRYIGQTVVTTSGASSTTAQVTLSASVVDPDGSGLIGAKVDFIDLTSGKVLAAGVTVTQVVGQPSSGTANTVVTLSTGQYGSQSYVVLVKLSGGNYDNSSQAVTDKTATVVVSQPTAANTIRGGGTLANLSTDAGTYGAASNTGPVTYSVGLNYNKSLTNLQGSILLTIPQADGSVVYVKSNSLTSMTVTNVTGGKQSTVYTKASVYRLNADMTTTTLYGNVTLRMDVQDMTDNSKDAIGFTILSSQDSTLYYSNDWFYDTTTKTWKTRLQALLTGNVAIG